MNTGSFGPLTTGVETGHEVTRSRGPKPEHCSHMPPRGLSCEHESVSWPLPAMTVTLATSLGASLGFHVSSVCSGWGQASHFCLAPETCPSRPPRPHSWLGLVPVNDGVGLNLNSSLCPSPVILREREPEVRASSQGSGAAVKPQEPLPGHMQDPESHAHGLPEHRAAPWGKP